MNQPTYVYHIRMADRDRSEVFDKVGISVDPESRFEKIVESCDYYYQILSGRWELFQSRDNALEVEDLIHRKYQGKLKSYHIPKINFDGCSECMKPFGKPWGGGVGNSAKQIEFENHEHYRRYRKVYLRKGYLSPPGLYLPDKPSVVASLKPNPTSRKSPEYLNFLSSIKKAGFCKDNRFDLSLHAKNRSSAWTQYLKEDLNYCEVSFEIIEGKITKANYFLYDEQKLRDHLSENGAKQITITPA